MTMRQIANKMTYPCFMLCRGNGIAGGILQEIKSKGNFSLPPQEEDLTEFHFFNENESKGARYISGKWFEYAYNNQSGIKYFDEQVLMHPEIAKAGGYKSAKNNVPGFIKRTHLQIHEIGHHYYPVAQRYINVVEIKKNSKTQNP